jgi:signal transduction histidine kinase
MQTRVDKLVHDVRGSLNSISMNAELAKLLCQQNGNPEKIQHCLGVILRECSQCNALVEDFRNETQGRQDAEPASLA